MTPLLDKCGITLVIWIVTVWTTDYTAQKKHDTKSRLFLKMHKPTGVTAKKKWRNKDIMCTTYNMHWKRTYQLTTRRYTKADWTYISTIKARYKWNDAFNLWSAHQHPHKWHNHWKDMLWYRFSTCNNASADHKQIWCFGTLMRYGSKFKYCTMT